MKALKTLGRYLICDDGTPFFYLGDTAWELFHRLNREEIEHYMAVRAEQGFTAVQCVALAEKEGLTVPNAYGRLPLCLRDGTPDPTLPDTEGEYSYWDHVDYAVETAARHGIYMTLLPTWGDKFNLMWGKGPEVFDEENAYIYGKWIASRYKDAENIIWMLGGDRPLESKHRKIMDAMAIGIREADTIHLITFHPRGCSDSTDCMADADYIDFHTSQTGHNTAKSFISDSVMNKMARATKKPYLDSEPRYEDHPACFDPGLGYYWDADDTRQNLYWNILSGACGHTYGNHCIWCISRESTPNHPYTWDEALTHTGAYQMQWAKKLRLSRDYLSLCPAPQLIKENHKGMGHMTAAMGDGYAYIYSPLGLPFDMDMGCLGEAKCIKAIWFDPRTGEEQLFSVLPHYGENTFVPPTGGKGCDWVLILEAVK